MAGERVIRIIGDVTIDWLILQPRGAETRNIDINHRWGRTNCRMISQAGGAALLSTLLKEIAAASGDSGKNAVFVDPEYNADALRRPTYRGVAQVFMSWSPFPAEGRGGRKYAWRIREFLGEDQPVFNREKAKERQPDDDAPPDILVIEDTNFGFRNNRWLWPGFLASEPPARARKPGQVLLKVAHPLDGDPLLDWLIKKYAGRLTVFTNVSDLRKSGCQVGSALSWEQLYEEIVREIAKHGELKNVARVIVALGASGAVMIEKKENRSWLVFDPIHQEGDWEKGYQGTVVGYGTCIAASLVWSMAMGATSSGLVEALKKGCQGARALHESGYQEVGRTPSRGIAFPYEKVVSAVLSEPYRFADAQLDMNSEEPRSILGANLGGNLKEKARELVLRGPEGVLSGIPVERIGMWTSVDRGEIESMRSVSNIVAEYVSNFRSGTRLERPLSLVVFGPPGSGKSFAIKQIARSMYPGLLKDLEFNLSQFCSVSEMPAAFHQVRDLALEQYMPLVFWDEFDTTLDDEELGWLKHFLAPMQDGHFREGGIFHPIGPAIFVFAGSRYATMEEFTQKGRTNREREMHSRAKKEDFQSRLKGFVNILGPNKLVRDETPDRNYVLRRAFLLRNILIRKEPQLLDENKVLNIDKGVLNAFMEVKSFHYGARSIEAIVDMSSLSGKGSFGRSCLPARHQLALHVDADEFLSRVRSA